MIHRIFARGRRPSSRPGSRRAGRRPGASKSARSHSPVIPPLHGTAGIAATRRHPPLSAALDWLLHALAAGTAVALLLAAVSLLLAGTGGP
jgi:hypothetical protein